MTRAKGALLIIAAMLIFAVYGILVRGINVSAIILVFWVQLIGALFLFYFYWKDRKKLTIKKYIPLIIGLVIVAIINDTAYFMAFRETTIANAVLAHYTAPIFVALFAPFLLKEKLERATVISLILALVGLIIMLYPNGLSLTGNFGIMLGTLSGLMYGFVIIFYKKLTQSLPVLVINFFRYLLSALILFPVVYYELGSITLDLIYVLIGFGLLFSVVASSLHIKGISLVKAQHAGIIGYVEPFAAAVYAIILLNELPTLFTLVGGAMILLSSYLAIRK